MVARVTATNTKAQIFSAYKEAVAELKEKDKELRTARSSASSASAAPTKAAASGAPSSVGGVIASLNTLRDGFGKAVSTLSATLSTEANNLDELRDKVDDLTDELAKLYDIDVDDDTLGNLIQALLDKVEAAETAEEEAQDKFDDDLTERRANWKKEREEQSEKIKERDAELRKARKRESEEFKYELQQRRSLESDTVAQGQKVLQKELDDLQEAFDKAAVEKEAEIKEREKAAKDAKSKVDKMPKELEAAVKKAAEEGSAIAKRQASVKANLNAKEHEGRQRVYKLRISTMEETIGKQTAQIEKLSNQLGEALSQAQGLAVKAIEGAASASSFEAIREIAMEQAKTPQKK